MQTHQSNKASIEAFQSFYLAELDLRIQRSDVLGVATTESSSAALFYAPQSGDFTLLEKPTNLENTIIYDCQAREQWGTTVMVFGHLTNTGGYVASGHGTLENSTIKIKLANGNFYRIEVDKSLSCLAKFVSVASAQGTASGRNKRHAEKGTSQIRGRQYGSRPKSTLLASTQEARIDNESEDLTDEDLMRLRGEMPVTHKAQKNLYR